MSSGLRLGLLIASIMSGIVFFISSIVRGSFCTVFILFFVIKKKLNIKYSIVWILWALLSLIMAIFPQTFYELSHLLGIEMPVNAVFLIMIALLYGLTFYVYIMISKHNSEIIKLTYEVSSLKKQLEEKNK